MAHVDKLIKKTTVRHFNDYFYLKTHLKHFKLTKNFFFLQNKISNLENWQKDRRKNR